MKKKEKPEVKKRENRTLTISIENHLWLSRIKIELSERTRNNIDFDDVIEYLKAIDLAYKAVLEQQRRQDKKAKLNESKTVS